MSEEAFSTYARLQPAFQTNLAEQFQTFDGDHDGVISFEEFNCEFSAEEPVLP